MRRTVFAFLFVVLTGALVAQMAPRETVTAVVGGAKLSVEYGRPSLKGRSFSELTAKLSEDRMWRAGSEQITTLTTGGAVMIGGKMVPPGKYSLYVHCPADGTYSLAVNKVLGQPLGEIWSEAPAHLAKEPWPQMNYQKIKASEVARIPLKLERNAEPVDLFTITLDGGSSSGRLNLAWGDTRLSADIKSAKPEGSYREGS
jgi:hypothetical protein